MDQDLEFSQVNDEPSSINDGQLSLLQVKSEDDENNTHANSATDILRKVLNITEVSFPGYYKNLSNKMPRETRLIAMENHKWHLTLHKTIMIHYFIV